MERLADYISRIIRVESEGQNQRTPKGADSSQPHAGGDSQGICDQTGSPQRHRSGVGQTGSVGEQD